MTGLFLNAFNKFKNLFTQRGQLNAEAENNGDEYPGQNQRLTLGQRSRLFPTLRSEPSRKRQAEHLIEIEVELTDDEDEYNPSWSGWRRSQNFPKRFRSLENNQEWLESGGGSGSSCGTMSQSDRRKIATRGSGISPFIEGLEKQPWQFNFNFKDPASTSTSRSFDNQSQDDKLDLDEYMQGRSSGAQGPTPAVSGSSSSVQNQLQLRRPISSQNTGRISQEPEVITINDDAEAESCKSHWNRSSSTPVKNDGKFRKKRFGSGMKASSKQPFSKFISRLGMPTSIQSSTIRLQERNSYVDLVRKFQTNGVYRPSALKQTKVPDNELKAMFQKWPDTNASPSVTISRYDKSQSLAVATFTPQPTKLLDQILAGGSTFLSSTPSGNQASRQDFLGSPESPICIDLENEDANVPNEKSPESMQIIPRASTSSSESQRTPRMNFNATFVDLDDALNFVKKREDETEYVNKGNDSVFDDTTVDNHSGDDICILSETILSKGRRLNSLALEQSTSPYIKDHRWLKDLSTSWRENQKARDKEIQENLETIDILHKESTLERDLRERMRQKLTLNEIIVLEEPEPELPPITNEMRMLIKSAKSPGRESDVLTTAFNIDITRGDIATLFPCKWLNDNVINFYMELLIQRSKSEEGSFPKIHIFSTFFYPKLMKEGYSNTLKRWTRKVDIFAHDLVIFPIHLGLHWCLACADLRTKKLRYYDSLGGRNDKCLNGLLAYLTNEMKERKTQELERDQWELENVEKVPMQENGSDCGVFTCKFAEYLSRDAKLTFEQEDMNYYRDRMIYEIVKQDLMSP